MRDKGAFTLLWLRLSALKPQFYRIPGAGESDRSRESGFRSAVVPFRAAGTVKVTKQEARNTEHGLNNTTVTVTVTVSCL